jgi:hypothetical protein
LFGCGGAGLVSGAASCGGAGAEFELAEFALDYGLSFEGVVPFGGEQLPAERGEFTGGRDDRDLCAASAAGAFRRTRGGVLAF